MNVPDAPRLEFPRSPDDSKRMLDELVSRALAYSTSGELCADRVSSAAKGSANGVKMGSCDSTRLWESRCFVWLPPLF